MYLINAIYFKGGWQYAFNASSTVNGTFNLQDGSTANVPFMKQSITTNVYYGNKFRMIELPYGGGNSFSMYILDNPNGTQNNPVNINQFAASLSASGLTTAISAMQKSTVTLVMPKWEYSYSQDDFRPELATLGMGIALGSAADFSKMYNVPVYISKAIHKTYIKVDEEGTTAAAVTAIGISLTDVPQVNGFTLDHPFVYVIAEKQTGTILFTGILNDPSK
jgi:serpin B